MIKRIVLFYSDGFKQMKVGKTLWLIIAIKFFLFFILLKLFFFHDVLQTNFSNDTDRANFVIKNLTNP
ncbi:MAG: DUF4492 domain-containing protein [Sulfurospirillaceae bacterium]|nr:DUF4492 domain-containing protein [Sulfurospirillaceae bacterium]MDD2827695.1 DUF4492 domain-containing protein [Sulfurospirillaceae bacterium]